MLTCKEVSKLVSESLDHELPYRPRLGMRFHLMMCSLCRTYRAQTLLLRQLFESYSQQLDAVGDPESKLHPTAADRIKRALAGKSDPASVDEPNKDV